MTNEIEPEIYFDPNLGYTLNNKKKGFKITNNEFFNILVAWIGISFAFSWSGFGSENMNSFLIKIPIILIATLSGFIMHELAHKFSAIYYGAKAEFKFWPTGLLFAIGLSLITSGGFVFAAPGAVYIWGKNITKKENGIISLLGPLSNFVMAIIALIISFFITHKYILTIFFAIVQINLFLGIFNMIPIPPLDGFKVFRWNKIIWVSLLVLMGLMFFLVFYNLW